MIAGVRCLALAVIVWLAVSPCGIAAEAAAAGDWESFKTHFVTADGRVIDPQNGDRSHSEGQGYGLLLAQAFGDRATFDRIARWTRDNLHIRHDNLHAWGWGLRPNGQWQVQDYNTATDGDVLIAHALLLAAERFKDPTLKAEAARIIADLRTLLAVKRGSDTLLLPGYHGFVTENSGVIVNPSYLNPLAYAAFAAVDDAGFWTGLTQQAKRQIQAWRFGDASLPPDWLLVTADGTVQTLPDGRSSFGFEAIRVPLYTAWAGEANAPALVALLRQRGPQGLEGTLLAPAGPPSAGFLAIYARVLRQAGDADAAALFDTAAREALAREPNNYYASVLLLLSGMFPGGSTR